MKLADGLVGALLRLYPREFRETCGADLMAAFQDQVRERRERGALPVMALLVRTGAGMAGGAVMEWTRTGRNGRGTMGRTLWDSVAVEVRQAGRRLARSPLFAVLALGTLGVGVGAFTSVYAVVDSVLLEPMPYEHPEELSFAWRNYSWFDLEQGWLGGPDVVWLREHTEAVAGVAAIRSGRFNMAGPEGTEPLDVRAHVTSANFFDLLGVSPALGRGFVEGEDAPEAPLVTVLGHELWSTGFGEDRGVLGRQIYLDGEAATVIGVLPEDFDFVKHASLADPVPADLYVPLRMDLASVSSGNGFLSGLVRARREAPPGAVDAALAEVASRLDDEWGNPGLELWAAPLQEELVADVRTPLLAILAAAGFLLLALATNLAALFLARMTVRERDTAVRTTLGAGRGALIGNSVSEALLVSVGGALLGLVLAVWGAAWIGRTAAETVPRASEIGVDGTSAALAVALAILLGVGASLAPLARALTLNPGHALRESGHRSGGSRRRSRARGALVVSQVALSMVLLVGAGLLGRSLVALLRTDPGFDPSGTLTARFSLDEVSYPEESDLREFHSILLERAAALPGVEAVGVANSIPMADEGTNQTGVRFVDAPGNTGDEQADQPLVDYFQVSTGYVRAAGLRVLEGSPFLPLAGEPGSQGVLVDETLAQRFFPGTSAVGGRLWIGSDTLTIAGVVDQPRFYDLHADDRGQVYLPADYSVPRSAYVALRTSADPMGLVAPLRNLLTELDPGLPLSEVAPLDGVVDASLGGERLNASLVAAFALAALLLASLGLYGVVANSVAHRRGELGVRMAVGANAGQVVRLVVSQGLRLVGWGVALGLAGAAASARFLASLLYGIDPWDPWTYAGVAMVLGLVAGVAAWLPARRATGIDPAEALRAE